MTPDEQYGNRPHPINQFLPTELSDFDIKWGSHEEWRGRAEKVRGTTAERAFHVLCLYWKYAWNTARCPWQLPNYVEQVLAVPGTCDKVWHGMLSNSESQQTIIGTQFMAYTGFYFAYEHFVVRCCVARDNTTPPSIFTYSQIKESLELGFNEEVEHQTWSSPAVERIRRVRNDITHNSGHPSQRTAELAPDMIIEGHLAVTPNDITEAFSELKKCVDTLLDQHYPIAT